DRVPAGAKGGDVGGGGGGLHCGPSLHPRDAARLVLLVTESAAISTALFAYDRTRGRYVCGADEVGMACWAGPIVAAAVRFDYDRLDADVFARLEYLNSSKKVTAARRAALLPVLLEVADMV